MVRFSRLSSLLRGACVRRAALWAACCALAGGVLDTAAWPIDRIVAAAQRIGPAAAQGALALQTAMAVSSEAGSGAQLDAVNVFFNRRIVFRDDQATWGQHDYWASPLETLGKGAGDCEDYAIAKYFTLVALGVPHARLRLVYVGALAGGPGGVVQPHMVLAHYAEPTADPSILDNLITEVRPASRRPDLVPVFSFNADGLWQGVGAVPAGGDPSARFSRWRDVLARAREEGFL